ncbi:hypothetical protein BESB_077180 [Besnoitia besnoiti]|uniref:Uncharacterized protein n=1 Tax=Besnoitia besnoiti TaxID=94643 RepID=A0A2A9MB17_BESBE|nr:hypothetical protein BESB_077180 [Besnoitia besnoiti]PFH33501.1 hypothetical protein BESB_077180 [Besnoitia besnoiti]
MVRETEGETNSTVRKNLERQRRKQEYAEKQSTTMSRGRPLQALDRRRLPKHENIEQRKSNKAKKRKKMAKPKCRRTKTKKRDEREAGGNHRREASKQQSSMEADKRRKSGRILPCLSPPWSRRRREKALSLVLFSIYSAADKGKRGKKERATEKAQHDSKRVETKRRL